MVASRIQTVGAAMGSPTNITMAAYTGSHLVAACSGRVGHISRAGWTHIADVPITGTGPDQLCVIWRQIGAESTSLSFSAPAASGRVWVSELGGVGDPIQNPSGMTTTSTGSDLLAATGVAASSLLYAAACGSAADAWSGGGWTQGGTGTWTEIEDGSGGGHPYSNGAFQVVGAGGTYNWQPTHGFSWAGWSPRGEAMMIVEFPAGGGGGGSSGPGARVINSFRRRLWSLDPRGILVPNRRLVRPSLAGVGFEA